MSLSKKMCAVEALPRVAMTAAMAVALAACGGGEDGDSGDGNGSNGNSSPRPPEVLERTPDFISDDRLTTTFDVDFQPDLERLELADRDALLLVNEATGEYIFDSALAQRAGLQFEAGSPLLIDGLALRVIESVSEEGDRTVVRTRQGTLEDAIRDGQIGWDYDVEFTTDIFENAIISTQKARYSKGNLVVEPGVHKLVPPSDITLEVDEANREVSISFTEGDIEYDMDFQLNQNDLKVALNITKSYEGRQAARFSFVGDMQAPRSRLDARYAGGEVQTVDYDAEGVTGKLRFEVVAAGSGPEDLEFELPAPIFKYPILIGGVIPGTIEYGVGFHIKTNMPPEASAQVSNEFTFDTSMGFQLVDEGIMTQSTLGPLDLENGEADLAANFTSAGAGLQVEFPKVSMSILNSSVVAALALTFEVVGNISFGPVCQKVDLAFKGDASIDTSILGVIPISKVEENLFEREKPIYQDTCE